MTYTPSSKDGPHGPRDNKQELEQIAERTADFAEGDGPAQALDPFSPENCPKLSLVVQMRIYDVLMALLNEKNPDVATALEHVHERGGIVGVLPYIDLR